MWRVDADSSAVAWRHATPFPHVVIDDVLADTALTEVFVILDDEPAHRYTSDLYAFDATAPEPTTDGFRALRERFARELAPVCSAAFGRDVTRVDMRGYAYGPGHYLLPHTDHQDGLGRVYAYAYYLPSPDPPRGGELELFRCRSEAGELVDIEHASLIEPRGNRLVIFEVGDRSLHQVREVLGGLRVSLAGWFYP